MTDWPPERITRANRVGLALGFVLIGGMIEGVSLAISAFSWQAITFALGVLIVLLCGLAAGLVFATITDRGYQPKD